MAQRPPSGWSAAFLPAIGPASSRVRAFLSRGDPAVPLIRRTHRLLEAIVTCVDGRAHLPVLVELREAA